MNDVVVKLSIPFPTEIEAEVVYNVLRVDTEPPRSGVSKKLKLAYKTIEVQFTSEEARKIRVGVTSFFESMLLVTQLMNEFGPPQVKYNFS